MEAEDGQNMKPMRREKQLIKNHRNAIVDVNMRPQRLLKFGKIKSITGSNKSAYRSRKSLSIVSRINYYSTQLMKLRSITELRRLLLEINLHSLPIRVKG